MPYAARIVNLVVGGRIRRGGAIGRTALVRPRNSSSDRQKRATGSLLPLDLDHSKANGLTL